MQVFLLDFFIQLCKQLSKSAERSGYDQFGRYGICLVLERVCYVNDPGIGLFLWRNGQKKEHFERIDAMFFCFMFVDGALDAFWL